MVYTPFKGIPETCTHERRPGTNVCLHCRHAALEAARDRRQRVFLRGSAMLIALMVLAGVGAVGTTALRDRAANAADAHTVKRRARSTVRHVASVSTGAMDDQGLARQEGAVRTPLASILPLGVSSLPQGVTAVRSDSDVTLSFDLPMLRTRKPLKFEYWVRSTLPQIYGAGVQGALARIPEGGIANQGELLNELPARGIHIPLDGGWTLEVFPQTRPGDDGPLVIRYRATVVR